jgi:hypothetical protein
MNTPKKPAKVMDAVHPVSAAASPTSRPIIIKNRDFMAADPMVHAIDAATMAAEEQSSGEPAKPVQPAGAQASALTNVGSEKTLQSASTPLAPDAAAPSTEAATDPHEKTAAVTDTSHTDEAKLPAEAASPEHAGSAAQEHSKRAKITEPTVADVLLAKELNDGGEATDADTTEAAPTTQELELEHHIAAGTYAVPIDTARRHRRTIVLIALAGLILAAVTLNILLDLSILNAPLLPHTNFL